MPGRVAGRVALITGGAQGMGESHSRVLAKEGARVVVADVNDKAGQAVADELGENAWFVHLDVTDPAQWEDALARSRERFGPLSVLVNNAGIMNLGAIPDYPLEDFRRIVEVNLFGTFNGINAAVPQMREAGGGSIINISSTAGLQGFPFISGYSATKWAVRGLSMSAAMDLGQYNIRINTIHPGQIVTPMSGEGDDMDTRTVALDRVGHPSEVSAAVVYLASVESDFVTATELVVDGGETAGRANWGRA